MRRLVSSAAAVAVFAAGLWAGLGTAGREGDATTPIGLVATLGAAQAVPRPTDVRVGATGRFVATFVRAGSGGRLTWRLTFRSLTGKAVAAHVHLARPGRAGPVATALCGPCRSGAHGTARTDARTVTSLLAGAAYVNVHTARNRAGEIRGQIRRGAVVLAPPTATGTTTTTTTTYQPPTTEPY